MHGQNCQRTLRWQLISRRMYGGPHTTAGTHLILIRHALLPAAVECRQGRLLIVGRWLPAGHAVLLAVHRIHGPLQLLKLLLLRLRPPLQRRQWWRQRVLALLQGARLGRCHSLRLQADACSTCS